jgi:hypothetical protein
MIGADCACLIPSHSFVDYIHKYAEFAALSNRCGCELIYHVIYNKMEQKLFFKDTRQFTKLVFVICLALYDYPFCTHINRTLCITFAVVLWFRLVTDHDLFPTQFCILDSTHFGQKVSVLFYWYCLWTILTVAGYIEVGGNYILATW